MKKKILISLICGVMVLGIVTGCGNTTKEKLETNNKSENETNSDVLKNQVISCVKITDRSNNTESKTDELYLENGKFMKSVFTTSTVYKTEAAYKFNCEYKGENEICDDETKTIYSVKTYLPEDISFDDIGNSLIREDGTVDIDAYIKQEEEQDYTCSVK